MQSPSQSPIYMLVGLGNPTDQYANTYHNVGKLGLLYLAREFSHDFERPSHKSFSYVRTPVCIYVFPETYMNESGIAVSEALKFFSLPPQSLCVLHDDSDMIIGTSKLAFSQRSAGHNGIQSIITHCGTQDFYRFKIGIRPEQEDVRMKAEDFVLKKISSHDSETLKEVFESMEKTLAPLVALQ